MRVCLCTPPAHARPPFRMYPRHLPNLSGTLLSAHPCPGLVTVISFAQTAPRCRSTKLTAPQPLSITPFHPGCVPDTRAVRTTRTQGCKREAVWGTTSRVSTCRSRCAATVASLSGSRGSRGTVSRASLPEIAPHEHPGYASTPPCPSPTTPSPSPPFIWPNLYIL